MEADKDSGSLQASYRGLKSDLAPNFKSLAEE
jgi:hypothetical protein